MNIAKFENIWKIMKDFDLDMGDFNKKELYCLICERVMIRASSGPCGCRYCFGCISQYVDEGNCNCPGTSSYCKEDILDYETNIDFDQAINSQVLRLKTRCPFESCSYKAELRQMEDHMKMCASRSESLPYSTVGRYEDKSARDFQRLPASIIKDVNTLKSEIEVLKTAVTDLKQSFEQYQNSELQKYSRIKSELIKWLNEEKRPMTTEEEWKQIDVSDLQSKSEGFSRELSMASVVEWSHANLDLILKSDQSIKDVFSKIDQLDRRMFAVETNIVKQSYGEFVWIIENITEKITDKKVTTVFSEAFHSHRNGYKMCLFIYPNGFSSGKGTHLYVGFCFLRGSFDDILPWPCKNVVTLTLMNQQLKSQHCFKKLEYHSENHTSWNRPTNNMNSGLGKSHFISLDKLLSNNELIENNKIIIKCTMDTSINVTL